MEGDSEVKPDPRPNGERPAPEPGAELKAFYMTVVPSAMRYAVQHAPFDVAQEVTQRTMTVCQRMGIQSAEIAQRYVGKNAWILHMSLRVGIVMAWRRDRRPGGTRAKPTQHIAPAEWKRLMDRARRNAILSSMMLVSKRSGDDTMSRLSPAEIDEMPLDAEVAALIDYFMHEMTAEDEEALEHRIAEAGQLFERVSPVAMKWVWPDSVLGQSDGGEWRPGRAMREKGWRDYQIPEAGVELMWARFCEMASGE
jgi:hypothetical protein